MEPPAADSDNPGVRHFPGRFTAPDGVRRHVARGTVINAAFLVGLSLLGFLKGFIVAGFLTTEEFGIWGIVVVTITTLSWLAQTGIGDKYIQQDEDDQETAFQKAFTLELMFVGIFMAIVLIAIPVFALLYGRSELLIASVVFALAFPAGAFRSPIWVYTRQMRFFRMRVLAASEPVVAFLVTVVLAVAGAGYWSLIAGIVAGAWTAAIASVVFAPYKLKLRYDRGTMREYRSFSWPMWINSLNGLVIAQVAILVGEWQLGLAAVGAIALTSTVTQFADRVDQIVTGALYPAICAVKNRTDLLFESFVKSNRLALMWGVPFGVAVSLFASDLVDFAIGEKWREAVPLLQAFGLIAAANHLGFNWDAFYRAKGNTRPLAVVSGAMAVTFLATTVPFMVIWGLDGFTAGMAIMTAVGLAGRAVYLTHLFPGFQMWRHMLRAIAPTVPAAGAVLLARAVETGERTVGVALAELAVYALVTVAATLVFERPLIREVLDYLRRGRPQGATAAT